MRGSVVWVVVLAGLTGCRCQPGPVEPIALGLRVQPAEVDFGRALEGTTRKATLTLTAATRAPISVGLATAAPFSAPASAEVPGGGDTSIEVSFLAGNGLAEGVLRLTVGEQTAEVKLRGVGVRPPDCRPSGECTVSVYSLEEDRCVESQAADDAPCDPASVCLEQGRCRAGACLGIARKCDDNDACTDDACAMDIGCVYTPHVCPTPTGACRAATCNPTTGCGEGPAPDLTPCGPQDCIEVNFCLMGVCKTQPTPEGLPCSPAIACLPEAECHNQRCTRVTEADWLPDWSARLAVEPTGGLTSSGATLFFSGCVDGGSLQDGGAGDAGADDGGAPDAGDGGRPLVCGLLSYTGTGFERFTLAYDDDARREVVTVSSAGVLVRLDGGLELRSPMTGGLRHALPVSVERERVVVERDQIYLWADGGVHLWRDGGLDVVDWQPEAAALARGAALFGWSPDAGLLTRLTFLADGGVDRRELQVTVPVGPSLAASGDDAIFGAVGRARLEEDGDGGFVAFDWTDAGAGGFVEGLTLSSLSSTNAFYLRCDGGCADSGADLWVRVFDTGTGQPRWDTAVVGRGFPGELVAVSLVDGLPGGFVALVRDDADGGARAALSFFADGERKAVCRLPPGSSVLEQAHFSAGALVITARRADGGLALESFGLSGLPISRSGWATPQGVGGTRSDRP